MNNWKPIDAPIGEGLSYSASSLEQLAAGDIPAIILRKAWQPEVCQHLVDRLIGEDLLYDPREEIPEKFRAVAIPEGYFKKGEDTEASYAWNTKKDTGRTRIDIGSSLGYRGSDPDDFFTHASESQAIFNRLFEKHDNPIELIYGALERLSRGKQAVTAYEPDGRQYCPAIIRAHYDGYTYKPHFDSVRLREKRENYSVSEFEHQFAGVLVLQNAQRGDRSAQAVIHQCLWDSQVDPHIQEGTFHEYAATNQIDNLEVCLEPGDLYFFNTRSIHEVPGLDGELPRIVVAVFIGFSSDREEIFVWS